MQTKNSIIEEQNFLGTLKTIATAYQEISVMKMKQTRDSIEHGRIFVAKLKHMFESLISSFPSIKENAETPHVKKLAKVLITANARFHGDILRRIFNAFIADEGKEGDILIVGKIGKDYLLQHGGDMKYTFYDVPDSNITVSDMRVLIHDLMQYETVLVYHAQFKTVVTQDIVTETIPSIYSLLEPEEKALIDEQSSAPNPTAPPTPLYLFEPSGDTIAEFMNDSVRASLTRQTLYETQLARYASRIKAMDALMHNIEDQDKNLKREKVKIIRAINNKKQLERISGILLWQS